MAFNTYDLDSGFESLEVENFFFKKEIMGYSWTRIRDNKIERIIIGYKGYNDSQLARASCSCLQKR